MEPFTFFGLRPLRGFALSNVISPMYGRSSKRTLVWASGGSFDLTLPSPPPPPPIKGTGSGADGDEIPGDGWGDIMDAS